MLQSLVCALTHFPQTCFGSFLSSSGTLKQASLKRNLHILLKHSNSHNPKEPALSYSLKLHCPIFAQTCSCGVSTEPQYIHPQGVGDGGHPSITHSLCSYLLPGIPKTLTPKALDFTFATNYIGPFCLQICKGTMPIFCANLTSPFS